MRRAKWVLLLSFLLLFFAGAVLALTDDEDEGVELQPGDEPMVAYTGARIYTCAGPVIERGTLLVHKGKVIAVGPVNEVMIPKKGAIVHDVSGKTIIPGLVDTHSHIGIFG